MKNTLPTTDDSHVSTLARICTATREEISLLGNLLHYMREASEYGHFYYGVAPASGPVMLTSGNGIYDGGRRWKWITPLQRSLCEIDQPGACPRTESLETTSKDPVAIFKALSTAVALQSTQARTHNGDSKSRAANVCGVDRATWDLLQVPLNEGAKLTAAQMFLLANPGIALLHVVHFEDNMPACTVYWQAAPLIFHCA